MRIAPNSGGYVGPPAVEAEPPAPDAEQAHAHHHTKRGQTPARCARAPSPTPARNNTPLRPRRPPNSAAGSSDSQGDENNDTTALPSNGSEESGIASTFRGAPLQTDSSADSGDQDHGDSGQDRGGRRKHKGFAFSEIRRAIDSRASCPPPSGPGLARDHWPTPAGPDELVLALLATTRHVATGNAQHQVAPLARLQQLALIREHLLAASAGPVSKVTLAAIKALLMQHQQSIAPAADATPPGAGEASRNALMPVMLLHALRPRLPPHSAAAADRVQVLERLAQAGATMPELCEAKP